MALRGAGRNIAGAGFVLVGIALWVSAAVGVSGFQARGAFLGVTLGGMLAMAGLAVSLIPGRRIRRRRYF